MLTLRDPWFKVSSRQQRRNLKVRGSVPKQFPRTDTGNNQQ